MNFELGACRDEKGRIDGAEVIFKVKENGLIASSISANAGTQSGDAVRGCVKYTCIYIYIYVCTTCMYVCMYVYIYIYIYITIALIVEP